MLGHVLVSRVGFEPDSPAAARGDALVLAPLAVLPAHAGGGIGTALTRAVLAAVDARDEAFVAVVGAPSFYERFDFIPAEDVDMHSSHHEAGPASRVRSIGGRPIRPGTVVYPPAFEAVSGQRR